MSSQAPSRGSLAVVLHTHMPYVEGFGTWPFGEEWLWEAIATSYLPLLDVLPLAPFTLSVTPVLADQLEAADLSDRFYRFIDEVRVTTHLRDAQELRKNGEEALAQEIERSAADYQQARRRMEVIDGDLLGAIAPYVSSSSAATHAILPLLASDELVRTQISTGLHSHRRRFGRPDWFWLPECAYDDQLDELLLEAGIDAVCVDLTDLYGCGAIDQLYPHVKPSGLKLVPIDRAVFELAWSDNAYPAKGAYRDSHRLTRYHHMPYANSGEPYDRALAREQAAADGADFVAAAVKRLDDAFEQTGRPGLSVCTFDTEFFGHWWFEGVEWLRAVAQQAQVQGLEIVTLREGVDRLEAQPIEEPVGTSSWGTPRTLHTWDNDKTTDMVWQTRRAEIDLLSNGDSGERAWRELLALQSSDWAFLETWDMAGPYPRERFGQHLDQFAQALGALQSGDAKVRNLAPDLSRG